MQLQFSPIVSQICVNVSIVDDSILESDEQFEVLLETSEPMVTLSPSTAAVSIIDNDSMWFVSICRQIHQLYTPPLHL